MSCEKTNVDPPKQDLASVTFETGFSNIDFDPDSEFYLMASASDGSVIDYKKLEFGKTLVLQNMGQALETFTLSFVERNTKEKFIMGLSYQLTPIGSEIQINAPETGAPVQLDVNGFEGDANSYRVSLPGHSETLYGPASFSLLSEKNNAKIYVVKTDYDKGDIGFYLTEKTYTTGQTHQFNLTNAYQTFNEEEINLNTEFDFVFANLRLFGRSANEVPSLAYFVSNNWSQEGDKQIVFRKPGTIFPTFSSVSTIYGDYHIFSSISTSKAYDFSIPELEIEKVESKPGQVNFSIIAENGYVGSYFMKEQNNGYIEWYVTDKAGLNKTVRVPNLPKELTNFIADFNPDDLLWTEEVYLTWPQTNLTIGEIMNYDLLGWLPNDVPVVDVKFLDIYLGEDELKLGRYKGKAAAQGKKREMLTLKNRFQRTN
ncbi:MAG: hypothetical protein O9302_11050 [Cyclobacteriaceae bacterium]|nr:hypothetical protein [Cyclobacteriaceae bacterium]